MSFNIENTTKTYLLSLAKHSIFSKLSIATSTLARPDDDVLNIEVGAFVTLKINDRLRGCIGFMEGVAPLEKTISELACMAAFEDNRFRPVSVVEAHSLSIEITILSPLIDATVDDIVVGRDGLHVSYIGNRGVLLPQVATEYGWDKYEFLSNTCEKAGLDKQIWKNTNIDLKRFEALIFSSK